MQTIKETDRDRLVERQADLDSQSTDRCRKTVTQRQKQNRDIYRDRNTEIINRQRNRNKEANEQKEAHSGRETKEETGRQTYSTKMQTKRERLRTRHGQRLIFKQREK